MSEPEHYPDLQEEKRGRPHPKTNSRRKRGSKKNKSKRKNVDSEKESFS